MSDNGIKHITHIIFFTLLTFFLSSLCNSAYALPFTITPSSSNPVKIVKGTTLTASYTVTNNTDKPRNNNYVKYLPLNTQVQANGCGSNFNLAPVGQVGDSCTLNLTITGPVNGGDRNPHHHLFVCFPGGETCNGPNSALNIPEITLDALTITPASAQIPKGLLQQFTATASYSDNTTQNVSSSVTWSSSNSAVGPINSNGLAAAQTVGTTNFSATQLGIVSNTAVFTVLPAALVSISVTPTTASIFAGTTQHFAATGTYTDTTVLNLTSAVTWSSSNTTSTTINAMGLAIGIIPTTQSTIVATQGAITSNSVPVTVTGFAYLVDNTNEEILVCPINPDSTFGNCNPFNNGVFLNLTSIAISPNNKFLYVTNGVSYFNFVTVCPINVDGSLLPCAVTGSNITNGQGVAINSTGTYAYISNINNTVTVCAINSVDGTLSGCHTTGSGFSIPLQASINPMNTFAYFPNVAAFNVNYCAIQPDGTLTLCANVATSLLGGVTAVTINSTNSIGYVTIDNGVIYACPIKTDGTFGACPIAIQGLFIDPTSLVLTPSTTMAYVIDAPVTNNVTSYRVSACTINSNGGFFNCVAAFTAQPDVLKGIALTP
ncbi:MAG: Ig-like domain-containing protein [Gammaproteobacteria bacterium]|nr:Ig-like domain-containing protein [Gammaproteobacteria bacterium]